MSAPDVRRYCSRLAWPTRKPAELTIAQSTAFWNDRTIIGRHTLYDEKGAALEETPAQMPDAPLNPKANHERMSRTMFETIIPAMHVIIRAITSLYPATLCVQVAGRDLTENLAKIISEQGYSLTTTAGSKSGRDAEAKGCCIASDVGTKAKAEAVTLARRRRTSSRTT